MQSDPRRCLVWNASRRFFLFDNRLTGNITTRSSQLLAQQPCEPIAERIVLWRTYCQADVSSAHRRTVPSRSKVGLSRTVQACREINKQQVAAGSIGTQSGDSWSSNGRSLVGGETQLFESTQEARSGNSQETSRASLVSTCAAESPFQQLTLNLTQKTIQLHRLLLTRRGVLGG